MADVLLVGPRSDAQPPRSVSDAVVEAEEFERGEGRSRQRYRREVNRIECANRFAETAGVRSTIACSLVAIEPRSKACVFRAPRHRRAGDRERLSHYKLAGCG